MVRTRMGGRVVLALVIVVCMSAAVALGATSRTYAWSFGDRTWRISVVLSETSFEYFASLPRGSDYSAYVAHGANRDALATVVDALGKAARSAGFDPEKTAGLVISFVQGLPYVADDGAEGLLEYPKYPLETLFGGGDCEDTAILAAALMKDLGLSVGLLHFVGTLPAHMAVGVALPAGVRGTYFPWEGKRYYYGETTEPGWSIGEVPPFYRGEPAYIELV